MGDQSDTIFVRYLNLPFKNTDHAMIYSHREHNST